MSVADLRRHPLVSRARLDALIAEIRRRVASWSERPDPSYYVDMTRRLGETWCRLGHGMARASLAAVMGAVAAPVTAMVATLLLPIVPIHAPGGVASTLHRVSITLLRPDALTAGAALGATVGALQFGATVDCECEPWAKGCSHNATLGLGPLPDAPLNGVVPF
ncbi:hypothetical protein ATCC90586_009352 [Pythium insidiosum]|nr:hypothetical protein ATCC90586_009352 [Pythium insidiosum]